MDKTELEKIIGDVIDESLEPLKERQTAWSNKIFEEGEKKMEKGLGAARIVRALAAAKGDPEKASAYAKKVWGDDEISKALNTGTGSAGGFLVPEEYSTELIELLRPQTVVRRMGANVIPMPTGTLNIPKLAGGGSASYVGEGTGIGVTEQTFGQVTLTWKKLAALVPISNDLLRFSSPAADTIVRDDLVAALAQKEDEAFITYSGSVATAPKGLYGWCPAANSNNVTSAPLADLQNAVYLLKKANVRFLRPCWIMSPRTELYLLTLRDAASGVYLFRDEMLTGRLLRYPYAATSIIPDNLGSNKNESQVYLVDMADAVIGEATELIIDISSEASYTSAGTTYSAFQYDQTVVKAVMRHDFAMRHAESVAVIEKVLSKWNA